eukprot:Em0025g127a
MDAVWDHLSKEKDASGNFKFPIISKVAKLVLTIPHTNADAERVFIGKNKVKSKSDLALEGTLSSLTTCEVNQFFDEPCYHKQSPHPIRAHLQSEPTPIRAHLPSESTSHQSPPPIRAHLQSEPTSHPSPPPSEPTSHQSPPPSEHFPPEPTPSEPTSHQSPPPSEPTSHQSPPPSEPTSNQSHLPSEPTSNQCPPRHLPSEPTSNQSPPPIRAHLLSEPTSIRAHLQSEPISNQSPPLIRAHLQSESTSNQSPPPITAHLQSEPTSNQNLQSDLTSNQSPLPIRAHLPSEPTSNQSPPPITAHLPIRAHSSCSRSRLSVVPMVVGLAPERRCANDWMGQTSCSGDHCYITTHPPAILDGSWQMAGASSPASRKLQSIGPKCKSWTFIPMTVETYCNWGMRTMTRLASHLADIQSSPKPVAAVGRHS